VSLTHADLIVSLTHADLIVSLTHVLCVCLDPEIVTASSIHLP